jgi:hypothetical protein
MKKYLSLLFVCTSINLHAVQAEPWLGNWLEFEGAIDQKHTQSKTVDTKNGTKHIFLHQEKTSASLEFMPDPDVSAEAVLDLTKTQKRSYGFDALTASGRWKLLNDLAGDPVTLTAGLVMSLSTPKHVKDLSSTKKGVFETEARLAIGREFGLQDNAYNKVWLLAKSGIASTGSPWIGFEAVLGRSINDRHNFDIFFRSEKGLSSHKLYNKYLSAHFTLKPQSVSIRVTAQTIL